MPLPPFDEDGNLPPGVHAAIWAEFAARFGTNERRRALLDGLKAALDALREAGCNTVYVNGSFVTAKTEPGDFDACWDEDGVDLDRLDPVLLTFANRRAAQKAKFGGELFRSQSFADVREDGTRVPFVAFFQYDTRRRQPKGVAALNLGELP